MPGHHDLRRRPRSDLDIIRARRLDQLESNLNAVYLVLPDEITQTLDEMTKPTLSFPHSFLGVMHPHYGAGTTINGRTTTALEISPEGDEDCY